MLQAIKSEPTPRPAANREREPGLELQDPAFAGYLAFASNFANLPTPAAAPPPRKEAPPERVEASRTPTRPEPNSERASVKETGGREEPRAVEDPPEKEARPKTAAPETAQTPSEDIELQEKSVATEKVAADPAKAAEPKPSIQVAALAAAIAKAPTSSTLTGSEETSTQSASLQAPAAALESVDPKAKGQRALGATGTPPMTASRAQETLEQAAPGVQLRFQFSEGTPTASAKPALTELLSLPKPEIQAPKLPTPGARAEALPAREIAPPPPPAPIKAPEIAPSGPTQSAQAPGIREAAVAFTAKVEPLAGKTSSASGTPLSLSGTTTLVKGSTPVPGLESPQGARPNATFAQMDGSIRWLIKNQEKGAEIQLNPESLGRVVIKLRVEGGEVHARLWASEASTVPILQDHKAALEASLRQQGLSLGSFDLQQGRRGHDAPSSAPSDFSGSGPGIATPQEKKQDLPSVAPALLGGARLIEVFA